MIFRFWNHFLFRESIFFFKNNKTTILGKKGLQRK